MIPDKWKKYISNEAMDTATDAIASCDYYMQQGICIYPPKEKIFNALSHTAPENVKVVILGQDPYHEPNQAMGLSFSVPNNTPLPPSLQNIFKELVDDIKCPYPASGDLTKWTKEGVLLLNTVLTVEKGKANSHKTLGWEKFTSEIVKACLSFNQPIVFLAWGRQAINLIKDCSEQVECHNDYVICSTHPSPLSANKSSKNLPSFIGRHPFSKANKFLVQNNTTPINWQL